MNTSKLAFAAVVVTSCLIIGLYHAFFSNRGDDPWERHMAEKRRKYDTAAAPHLNALGEAHLLWDSGRTTESIAHYKRILRQEGRSYLGEELAIVYRRVIEYEADYGDPGEARDWCLRARSEWNLRISFSSDEARRIWTEVVVDTNQRPERLWERVLNR